MSESRRIAFVCPRYAFGPTVGGAETLLKQLAVRARSKGLSVDFLTTCARNHFTWENELPAGERTLDEINVIFFPVDKRNVELFLRVQNRISNGSRVTEEDERTWLQNNVNSRALCDYLQDNLEQYHRVILGPYLFGLIHAATLVARDKALLVPCLHDEPFAHLSVFHEMFETVHGCMFNTPPEQDLAQRIFGTRNIGVSSVVGMGIDDFNVNPDAAIIKKLKKPYILYCGRREPLKGTPLLLDYMAAFRARTGRDVQLVFTGSGQIEVPIGLKNSVTDLGFVSEEDKHNVMAGALAFCHPSINESLSIVLLEAWLAGTPALVHGKSAVLKHQCGRSNGGLWFVNYPEFEEELCFLMDNPATARTLAANGRQYVLDQYSWDKVTANLSHALEA